MKFAFRCCTRIRTVLAKAIADRIVRTTYGLSAADFPDSPGIFPPSPGRKHLEIGSNAHSLERRRAIV
jgi:hypothetical protein